MFRIFEKHVPRRIQGKFRKAQNYKSPFQEQRDCKQRLTKIDWWTKLMRPWPISETRNDMMLHSLYPKPNPYQTKQHSYTNIAKHTPWNPKTLTKNLLLKQQMQQYNPLLSMHLSTNNTCSYSVGAVLLIPQKHPKDDKPTSKPTQQPCHSKAKAINRIFRSKPNKPTQTPLRCAPLGFPHHVAHLRSSQLRGQDRTLWWPRPQASAKASAHPSCKGDIKLYQTSSRLIESHRRCVMFNFKLPVIWFHIIWEENKVLCIGGQCFVWRVCILPTFWEGMAILPKLSSKNSQVKTKRYKKAL